MRKFESGTFFKNRLQIAAFRAPKIIRQGAKNESQSLKLSEQKTLSPRHVDNRTEKKNKIK